MQRTAPRFVLYSRPGCGLCEDMLMELAALQESPAFEGRSFGVDVLDVDADPATRSRYGHKIPVLLFDGELVCHGRLDPDEVHKTLAYHRRPV
jgi:predicted thioredoxin/glutaredoxin